MGIYACGLSHQIRVAHAKVDRMKQEIKFITFYKFCVTEYVQAIITANESLKTLSTDAWFENAENQFNLMLEMVQDKLNTLESQFEKEELRLNMQLEIAQNNEDYLNVASITKELLDNKVALRDAYAKEYQQLLDSEVDMESDYCRELESKYYDLERDIYNYRRDMIENAISLNEYHVDSINTLVDKYSDKLKQVDEEKEKELKKQKDAIKEQQDAYNDYIDQQKDSLDNIKKQYDYENKIAELKKKLGNIQSDLNQTAFSNDAESILATIDLTNKYEEAKGDLEDEYFDKSIEIQQDILDNLKEIASDRYENQIKEIENAIDKLNEKSDNDYKQEAQTSIQNSYSDDKTMKNIYDALISYNKEYGDGMDATIDKIFMDAKKGLDSINLTTSTLNEQLNNLTSESLILSENLKNISSKDLEGKELNNSENLLSSETLNSIIDGFTIQSETFDKALATLNSGFSSISEAVKSMNTQINPNMSVDFNVDGNLDVEVLNKAMPLFRQEMMNVLQTSLTKLGHMKNFGNLLSLPLR